MLSCMGWSFQGIKRQLIVLSRKLLCSLSGLVSREMQQWVVFLGTSDFTNSGRDVQMSL